MPSPARWGRAVAAVVVLARVNAHLQQQRLFQHLAE